jgi:hypothetical protein
VTLPFPAWSSVLLFVLDVGSPVAQSPAFEAATVKPNTAFRLDLNRSRAHILGLPGWADTEGWDIQAAAPGQPSTDEKRSMPQALLADRFKLAFHRETRQLPVFALAWSNASRRGPQLQAATDEAACQQPPPASQAAAAARTPFEAAMRAVRDVPCGRISGGILGDDRTQAWGGGRRVSLAMLAAS